MDIMKRKCVWMSLTYKCGIIIIKECNEVKEPDVYKKCVKSKRMEIGEGVATYTLMCWVNNSILINSFKIKIYK